jgi:predicted DNA-binding transcriptional regulator YafY
MSLNRLALIRYKTIDACLRNRARKWTLETLIDECSDAVYEYEGIQNGVSKRTVQLDIQLMRSDKLGYNAPIIVVDKKFYTYEDPKYSITNIPLTKQDLTTLGEVKAILEQFKGFSHFQEVGDMISRLEDKIYTSKTLKPSVIEFEKNERLSGLEHLNIIHQAIVAQRPLKMSYQSFKARQAQEFVFHAYLLKEYRNRWFVLGKRTADLPALNLALDRIKTIEMDERTPFLENRFFNANTYFDEIIGVTKSENVATEEVIFSLNKAHAPYTITKPIHSSQEIVAEQEDGTVIFKIKVQLNFELERELLGFGEHLEVLAPRRLRGIIKKRLQRAADFYENKESTLDTLDKKM